MAHHELPPHPNRVTMLVGFGHRDDWRPAVDSSAWNDWLAQPRRGALLLGRHPDGRWRESELALVVERVRDWSRRHEARVLVVTTRDSAAAVDWLEARLGDDMDLYRWRADDRRNPYGLVLEHASALLVAGASPGLLQDALAAPRPLYLIAHRPRHGWWHRLAARVAERAFRPSYNKRGSVRPQQGTTYLCARLIERGWVTPPTGLAEWQHEMVARGLASWSDDDAVPSGRYRPELDAVCARVLERLDPVAGASSETRRRETAR
jgi:hypothetical protein